MLICYCQVHEISDVVVILHMLGGAIRHIPRLRIINPHCSKMSFWLRQTQDQISCTKTNALHILVAIFMLAYYLTVAPLI